MREMGTTQVRTGNVLRNEITGNRWHVRHAGSDKCTVECLDGKHKGDVQHMDWQIIRMYFKVVE